MPPYPMDPLQIALIDDDASFCEMVKDHITKKFPNAQIAAHATGEAALDATLQKPDIIILDYSLDSVKADAMNGIQVLATFKDRYPDTRPARRRPRSGTPSSRSAPGSASRSPGSSSCPRCSTETPPHRTRARNARAVSAGRCAPRRWDSRHRRSRRPRPSSASGCRAGSRRA